MGGGLREIGTPFILFELQRTYQVSNSKNLILKNFKFLAMILNSHYNSGEGN